MNLNQAMQEIDQAHIIRQQIEQKKLSITAIDVLIEDREFEISDFRERQDKLYVEIDALYQKLLKMK